MQRSTNAILGLLAFALAGHAIAQQQYPSRPIRLIVPFPAGGNVDVFSRVLFRQVESEIGTNFVIDNRGGANGMIGADVVKNACRLMRWCAACVWQ